MPSSDRTVRVVIPARFGSTRLPGKPLLDLAGKPMIVRVHQAASRALPEAEIVIAIDDPRVGEVLDAHGIASVMTATDWESGTDRVAEVARLRGWAAEDVIINLQGDEPLLPPDVLQAFRDSCLAREEFQMATIAVPITDHDEIFDPNAVKLVTRQDGVAVTFSRSAMPFDRENPPEAWEVSHYRRHVGIYAYRNDLLQTLTQTAPCAWERLEKLEQLRALWLGVPIVVLDWPVPLPGGVDTPADADRVRSIFEKETQ